MPQHRKGVCGRGERIDRERETDNRQLDRQEKQQQSWQQFEPKLSGLLPPQSQLNMQHSHTHTDRDKCILTPFFCVCGSFGLCKLKRKDIRIRC